MSISAAQRKKDPHAGPHGSFPLDADHLKAAWDLAGHAANPEAVRAKVIAFARAHGMMDRLPKAAQDHAKHSDTISKATGDDLKAAYEYGLDARRRLEPASSGANGSRAWPAQAPPARSSRHDARHGYPPRA